jgi:hypothetical protein
MSYRLDRVPLKSHRNPQNFLNYDKKYLIVALAFEVGSGFATSLELNSV